MVASSDIRTSRIEADLTRDRAFVASRDKALLTDRERAQLTQIRKYSTDPSLNARIDALLAP